MLGKQTRICTGSLKWDGNPSISGAERVEKRLRFVIQNVKSSFPFMKMIGPESLKICPFTETRQLFNQDFGNLGGITVPAICWARL
jgi:hypothetical protein